MPRLNIFVVALAILAVTIPAGVGVPVVWADPPAPPPTCAPGGPCSINPDGTVKGFVPSGPKSGASAALGNLAPAGAGAGVDHVFITGAAAPYYFPFGQMLGIPANSTALSTAMETGQTFYEWAQTFILSTLKKRILDWMVADIVNWIQGGGEPRFISDWKSFLADAGNVAVGDLAVQIGAAGICHPFRDDILNNIIPKPAATSFNNSPITCTLDDIVNNIEDFYNDFGKGGWEAYISSWDPNNHPLAVFIQTESAKYLTRTQAQHLAEVQGIANQGFLSAVQCAEDLTVKGGRDIDGDKKPGSDIPYTCRIVTPGVIVGQLAKEAVGADFKFIVNADQLAEYVAAITDALIFRLTSELSQGLAGADYSSGGTPNNFTPADGPCGAFPPGPLFDSCDDYFGTNFGNFSLAKDRLLGDIDATLTPLLEALVFASSSRDLASTTLDFLAEKKTTRPLCVDQNDIDDLTAQLAALESTIAATNVSILELQTLRSDVEVIDLGLEDWGALTEAQTSAYRLMNPTSAEAFRDVMSQDYMALDIKINGSNSTIGIRQKVLTCTGVTP